MVASICIGLVAFAGAIFVFLRRIFRPRTPHERILRAQREAAWQVDDLYERARIRMEEAAGCRQPGEWRISDSFGSWNRW